FFLILSFGVGFIFFSCKKEPSCESCAGENKPPIANAGRDTLIVLPQDSIRLDGSASHDPDGRIIEYKWSQIPGTTLLAISNQQTAKPTLKNLVAGIHQF